MSDRPALLVIADIGGYTAFVKQQRASLAHAQDIIGRLLEAMIDAAPELTLVEVEGDAAFFFAWLKAGEPTNAARKATECSLAMHRAFRGLQQKIEAINLCRCQGCRGAKDLKVKFVAHYGDVVMQRVKQITKVAGLDVVLVHRMLKNGVPVPEYVLMSEDLYEHGDDALRGQSVALPQEFEGLGKVQTYFLDIDGIALAPLPPPRRTAWAMFVENVGVLVRAFPYRFGFRKPRFALSARGKP